MAAYSTGIPGHRTNTPTTSGFAASTTITEHCTERERWAPLRDNNPIPFISRRHATESAACRQINPALRRQPDCTPDIFSEDLRLCRSQPKACAVTIGNFDGDASRGGIRPCPSVVDFWQTGVAACQSCVTFGEPHPRDYFAGAIKRTGANAHHHCDSCPSWRLARRRQCRGAAFSTPPWPLQPIRIAFIEDVLQERPGGRALRAGR